MHQLHFTAHFDVGTILITSEFEIGYRRLDIRSSQKSLVDMRIPKRSKSWRLCSHAKRWNENTWFPFHACTRRACMRRWCLTENLMVIHEEGIEHEMYSDMLSIIGPSWLSVSTSSSGHAWRLCRLIHKPSPELSLLHHLRYRRKSATASLLNFHPNPLVQT